VGFAGARTGEDADGADDREGRFALGGVEIGE
jgi:hypothetical protein